MKEAKTENGLPSKIIPNGTGDEKIKRTKSKRYKLILDVYIFFVCLCFVWFFPRFFFLIFSWFIWGGVYVVIFCLNYFNYSFIFVCFGIFEPFRCYISTFFIST